MDEVQLNHMSERQQTVLLVSSDGYLRDAAKRELKHRRPDVRISSVNSMDAALQAIEEGAPNVILLEEGVRSLDSRDEAEGMSKLDAQVKVLGIHAPVVVIGRAERGPRLMAMVEAGSADYVLHAAGSITAALALLERRLIQAQSIADSAPTGSQEWSRDFAEVLRHELNNPLTGILGNAELLLAEISRQNDGRLPHGGLERVETIAALAMRMRETVRQLSHEWESRSDAVRSA